MRTSTPDLLEQAVMLCKRASDALHEPYVGPDEIREASEAVTRLSGCIEQLVSGYEQSLEQMHCALDNLVALQRREQPWR